MKIKILNKLLDALPLLLFTLILSGLLLVRILAGMVLPVWGAWGLGICWGIMAFDYLLRAELFKQIGGFAVMLLAVLILIGALIPQDQIVLYPRMASEQLVHQMESTWNAVYTGNIFKTYSLKQQLIDYGASLGDLDPFRHGKMILFGLLGFALAVCYLFPIEPLKRGKGRLLKHRWRDSLKSELNDPASGRMNLNEGAARLNAKVSYVGRFGLLFACGTLFALQIELLQVLSPTRMVTARSVLDSCFGFLIGLLVFVPVHYIYSFLAEHRAKGSPRFNVLGVGVDAVCMDDCLKLFEDIISGESSLQKSEVKRQTSEGLNSDLRSPTSGRHRPAMTSALGVAGIVEARRNPKMQRILNESVLNTPDGMPLVWLGKLFGYQQIERVYGPDLLRDVCAYSASRGWKHFFYGAAPGIVDKLKAELERKHPDIQIAGIYCPPFRPLTSQEEADLIAQVAVAKPDIFWIGISTPKQLYFMDQMRNKLDCKIICPVGYAFDVNAGVQEDAPDWAKYSGFQWLHRAIKQPRLWKRYLPDNPRFMFEAALQVLHLKKYPMFIHERPVKPFNDTEGFFRFPAGVVSLSAMTLQSARDRVLNWVKTGQKHYVNICTADTMVQCFDQPKLAKIVSEAGMATTDGMPLVWLAHHYGFKDASRVYGPDLMLALCEATAALDQRSEVNGQRSDQNSSDLRPLTSDVCCLASDLRPPISEKKCISHFFYGATDEVLAQLKTNLLEKFPNLQIAGMVSPPFRPLTEAEKDEMTELINTSGADIVWCGLGTPKQDYWVAEFRPRLNAAAILAVGAAFNFHAGHVLQAPRWMMKSGLEWLFRLGAEPKRLWRRYLIGNPRFILLTWRQICRAKSERESLTGK
ncbi:MAG: WecB/TagA/CpsF family glycosyltransferase [Kiritimatiellales bacterium]|nr:WecB/TagA/CpsF family glycosyltransferase [Kiritimatiellales bacterium]